MRQFLGFKKVPLENNAPSVKKISFYKLQLNGGGRGGEVNILIDIYKVAILHFIICDIGIFILISRVQKLKKITHPEN